MIFVVPLILQSRFAPVLMRPPSARTDIACVSYVFVYTPLKNWQCWCWQLPSILIPGFVTSRYVILTLPRWSAHSETTTLTTSICWHWGLRQCFIFSLSIPNNVFEQQQHKTTVWLHFVTICNHTAPLLVYMLWLSKEKKCESKEAYRPQAKQEMLYMFWRTHYWREDVNPKSIIS